MSNKVGQFLNSYDNDNPRDLQFWQLRIWIHDNFCDLRIKSDTGQHSKILAMLTKRLVMLFINLMSPFQTESWCNFWPIGTAGGKIAASQSGGKDYGKNPTLGNDHSVQIPVRTFIIQGMIEMLFFRFMVTCLLQTLVRNLSGGLYIMIRHCWWYRTICSVCFLLFKQLLVSWALRFSPL